MSQQGRPNLPEAHPPVPLDATSCPYSADNDPAIINPLNNMPAPNQQMAPDQKDPLSVDREVSTIPMGGKYDGKNWIYPSEQMFYNAMKRKNWKPNERDMGVVVPIHNAVNEQCWRKILEWEELHKTSCNQPKLLKFEGKPRDYSPKAWLRSLIGYKLPFDRHDWTVDRCGKPVRYVIDFYGGGDPGKSQAPVSFFLDVRPALTFEGFTDRVKMFWKTGKLMDDQEQRADGRSSYQIRPMAISLSPLHRADGSARFSFDKSSVLAAVFGPKEAKIKEEQMDRAFIDVKMKSLVGLTGTSERFTERVIRETLENVILATLHPRTTIQVTLQVMSEDGSMLATSINAVILALVDAGVPLRSMMACVTCAVKDGEYLLDPTEQELKDNGYTLQQAGNVLILVGFIFLIPGIMAGFQAGLMAFGQAWLEPGS
ncbi:hypothetical protein HDU76_012485 [Blyttiomyces sp. JEL0837]|nr:hypothetical protein HDU76_012485 [Blyttiomyces sp. JEL0837]